MMIGGGRVYMVEVYDGDPSFSFFCREEVDILHL